VDTPAYAIVGRIRKPHGIRGEVVVEPVTDAPGATFASGRRLFVGDHAGAPLRDPRDPAGEPRSLVVERARDVGDAWLVQLGGISDRNEAEKWRDRYLLLPFAELVPPAADEVYYHDLEGLAVVLRDGAPVGTVDALYELPQGLVLEVARPDKPSVMVQYRPDIVLEVDLAARTMRIDPPEGLLD
jgi:16S rRNA processing protein RimM